jgi:hypothetical protein
MSSSLTPVGKCAGMAMRDGRMRRGRRLEWFPGVQRPGVTKSHAFR